MTAIGNMFKGMICHRHDRGFTMLPASSYVCADCEKLFLDEWYMLKRIIWNRIWPGTATRCSHALMPRKHFLCIGCVEARIGRRLTQQDFDARRNHNTLKHNPNMSQRMRRRLSPARRSK